MPKRIILPSIGSRGDIQPYIALAEALLEQVQILRERLFWKNPQTQRGTKRSDRSRKRSWQALAADN